MQRRNFIRNTSFTLAGLSLFSTETIAAFFNQPAWKIKMLTDDIGVAFYRKRRHHFILSF